MITTRLSCRLISAVVLLANIVASSVCSAAPQQHDQVSQNFAELWTQNTRIELCGLVSISQNRPIQNEDFPGSITCLELSPDGLQLVVGGGNKLQLRQLNDLSVERQIETSLAAIHDAVFSKDGTSLFLVGGASGEAGGIVRLAWPSLNVDSSATISEDVFYSATFVGDKSVLAVAAHDHSVYFVNTDEDLAAADFSAHSKPVTDVAFIESSNQILSCSIDQTIRVWDATGHSLVRTLSNHLKPVRMMSLRPSTAPGMPLLASVSDDRTVRLWQPTIGRMVRFKRLSSPATSVVWTSDGRYVAVGCRDGSVNLVQPDRLDVQQIGSPSAAWINELVSTTDGRTIVSGDSAGQLRRLDVPE